LTKYTEDKLRIKLVFLAMNIVPSTFIDRIAPTLAQAMFTQLLSTDELRDSQWTEGHPLHVGLIKLYLGAYSKKLVAISGFPPLSR
jgi:hypothetical protein